jgi:ATP-dependent Lhr-like helicase
MDDGFGALHPEVAAWCARTFAEPTAPQRRAIPLGLAGTSFLLASPTGTGKTLAAFLPLMSRLAERRDRDELFARPFVLYISPLRALGYDVEHNLRRPLREMGLLERPNSERAEVRGGRIRERFLRTGVRTGDTPVEERRLMMARPPHILITTPESFALMIAMETYRKQLASLEAVVVDEIHALAGNKRGAYLALCLESLEAIVRRPLESGVRRPLVRIGLSATVAPLDRVAEFLAGCGRPCEIVDERGLRKIRLTVTAPFSGAMAPMTKIAEAAVEIGRDVRTQLVFTNVRSQAERLAHEMALLDPQEGVTLASEDARSRPRTDRRIGIHHSALERSVRHRVEAQLRAGEVHAVVCSSSLELGVDIGYIDRVCIVGGARGMTPALQRVGRAGHRPGAIAEGVVIAQDRDDIIEAAATKRCIADGTIEEIAIPEAPLDVLAQWLVASVCPDRRFELAAALAAARRAAPYRRLTEADLAACADYLSGGGAGDDPAHVRRIGRDGAALYGLGREVSAAFFENAGTIPDERKIAVSLSPSKGARGAKIGSLEENFAASLQPDDVFLLNGKTFRVRELRKGTLTVEPHAGRPNVPAWASHIKGMPKILADEIARIRRGLAERLRAGGPGPAFRWLEERYNTSGAEAAHAVRYVAQQMAVSYVPEPGETLIELYRIDRRQTAIFHTCAGRRTNEALARIVAARLFRALRASSQISVDDNGFLVELPPGKHLPDAAWGELLHVREIDADLLDGLRASHLLRRHFRYVANTGLLVLRRAGGRNVAGRSGRWNSERIFDRLWESAPDFPLLRETIRVVTRDLLDAPGARAYLESRLPQARIVHPPAASPFAFGIVTSSFGDSVVMDDRASMVEALHERILALTGDAEPPSREGEHARRDGELPLVFETLA